MNDVQPYREPPRLALTDVREQVNLIQEIMKGIMKVDEHYGVIPGAKKPSLLKAGAEKLCLTFRLAPDYTTTEQKDGNHLTVISKCTLTHIPSGQVYGSGMGSCSTKEAKYAYRQESKKCPLCGAESIIKGKDFKGDGLPTGWVCYGKKGGCGSKFADGDPRIEGQATGRSPNPDVADQYNTVLKMSNKRSLVAAVLNVTAASDIFTQDIEDMPHVERTITPEASAKVSETQATELKALCRDSNVLEEAFIAKFGPFADVDAADFEKAKAAIRRMKK